MFPTNVMRFFPGLLLLMVFFSGCGVRQIRQPPLREEDQPTIHYISWEILDYRNKDIGASIPAWVNYYLEGNIQQIENLTEFYNHFIFISSNTGTNFNALEQWMHAFSTDQDFARLVAARMENRFLNAAVLYPDDEYGSYFETLIRTASDAQWTGAVRISDFWLLRNFTGPGYIEDDELPETWERYDFLVLISVEKNVITPQIVKILQGVRPPVPLSRDQRNAVNRIQENFFDGF